MNVQGNPSDIDVFIAGDGSEAFITIPADFPREHLTAAYCKQRFVEAGGEFDAKVSAAFEQLVQSAPPAGAAVKTLVATKQPPVHGNDGTIEWFNLEAAGTANVAKKSVPGAVAADEPATGEAFSFYDCSAYIMVTAGQVLGHLTPPAQGVDGRDVRGRTLVAKAGKPHPTKLDESILCGADGRLIAQRDGVLQRTASAAKISARLIVPEYVDFSTGNIDFTGDVLVQRGVRDCFAITAGGNVEVHGLIEAATIRCGGSLSAQGGMAGRERGQVHIGGHLRAKYLDNVSGQIIGELAVQREAINCSLIIGGCVRMPHSAIIGGRVVITGEAEIGTVGSNAGTLTELVLGTVPLLDGKLLRLIDLHKKLTRLKESLIQENSNLQSKRGSLSNAQKERMTEVMYEMRQAEESLDKASAAMKMIDSEINKRRTVKLIVARRLHENTRLTICQQSFRVDKDVAGPLVVSLSERGEPVYRQGASEQRPLSLIARKLSDGIASAA